MLNQNPQHRLAQKVMAPAPAGCSRRIGFLRAYFSRERNFACSWLDVLGKIVRPSCSILANRQIMKIEVIEGYRKIYLRGLHDPLFWPENIPMQHLYMIITESLYETDWHYYEIPETRVHPGDVVLDCGAAEGLFCLKNGDRAALCVAIEPAPPLVDSLTRTFAGRSDVLVVPYALSSQSGHALLSRGALNSALSTAGEPSADDDTLMVDTITIDQLVKELKLPRVDYLKGDLESFELEVLKGAARTIRENRPRIAMTTYHSGNDWQEIRDYLLSLVPDYRWRVKGLSYATPTPQPVMIHFWTS